MNDLKIVVIDRSERRGGTRRKNYDLYVSGSIKGNRIHFGEHCMSELDISPGDEVLFGHVGSRFYICKKGNDANGHLGYTLLKHKGSASYYIANISLKSRMQPGYYTLGESVMKSGLLWFELNFTKPVKSADA